MKIWHCSCSFYNPPPPTKTPMLKTMYALILLCEVVNSQHYLGRRMGGSIWPTVVLSVPTLMSRIVDRNTSEFVNYQQIRGVQSFRVVLACRLSRLDLNKIRYSQLFYLTCHLFIFLLLRCTCLKQKGPHSVTKQTCNSVLGTIEDLSLPFGVRIMHSLS